MTRRWQGPAIALVALVVISVIGWPAEFARWRAQVWPVVRLWPDAAAQYRQQWGSSQVDLLQGHPLPRGATVLLVTPGVDWKKTEYPVYHRALYWLASRPVIWAAPFPNDGSWEARWHVPTALTPTALAARAAEVGADCMVAWNVPVGALPGEAVMVDQDGAVTALNAQLDCALPGRPIVLPQPVAWLVARALLAVLVIGLFGAGGLPLFARLGHPPGWAEAAVLCWLTGAAVATTLLLWLSAVGLPFDALVPGLSVLAVPVGAWGLLTWWRGWRATRVRVVSQPRSWPRRLMHGLLKAVIAAQVLAVAVTALGRPLVVWDSWVNWGMKARIIFLENGLTPALWADSTRLITLPDYPLFVPLLQAWTYSWLGQFDDRWAGLPIVLFYLALLVGLHASLRRQSVPADWALAAVAAVACLPDLANLTSAVYPDAVMAALATLSAAYLLEWTQRGATGTLLIAALAAGLLPWTKREGLVLALVLAGAAVLLLWRAFTPAHPSAGAPARARLRLAGMWVAAIAVFAGPWYTFTALTPVLNPAYSPVTLAGYVEHATRLLYVAWRGLRVAVEPRLSFVWLIAVGVLGLGVLMDRARPRRLDAATLLGFGVPLIYLVVLGQAYVFSAYLPFEQHIISSLERLVLPVSLLPVLWLALRTVPVPAEPLA